MLKVNIEIQYCQINDPTGIIRYNEFTQVVLAKYM